jgi:hypothetical protein
VSPRRAIVAASRAKLSDEGSNAQTVNPGSIAAAKTAAV